MALLPLGLLVSEAEVQGVVPEAMVQEKKVAESTAEGDVGDRVAE